MGERDRGGGGGGGGGGGRRVPARIIVCFFVFHRVCFVKCLKTVVKKVCFKFCVR